MRRSIVWSSFHILQTKQSVFLQIGHSIVALKKNEIWRQKEFIPAATPFFEFTRKRSQQDLHHWEWKEESPIPVSSPGDFESVQTIARTIKNSRVCALARCVEKDIDVAAELEEYLEDLESVVISFDGGKSNLNFAEAALMIQVWSF